jgi:hypothetical protein
MIRMAIHFTAGIHFPVLPAISAAHQVRPFGRARLNDVEVSNE